MSTKPDMNARSAILNFSADEAVRQLGEESATPPPDTETIGEIRRYLENPTRSGVWQLDAKWEPTGGISNYIWNELEKKFEGKEVIQIASGGSSIPLQLTDEQKEQFRGKVYLRASFQTLLFAHLCHLNGIATKIPEYPATDKAIFDILDLNKLQRTFADAYDYFKNEIYFEGFSPQIFASQAFHIRGGSLVVLESHLRSNKLLWISTNSTPVEKALHFFKKIGKISQESVRPVYSPEEVVFAPYFVLLKIAFPFLIGDTHSKGLFERAFEEYSREAFTNCVSTIGVIAEDYLTQVYETFFREVSPKGQTLGEIYDFIHLSIGRRFHSEPKSPADLTPIYNRIRELLKDDESDPSTVPNKELILLMRQLLNGMKEDKEYFHQSLTALNKKTESKSCFPKYLRENLNELIRHRNAASHKTRIPIGSYEALRTVYCLISLYIWWDNEKRAINWKADPESILKESIERNSKVQSR